jgi:TRAP-type C4-dicarboxylate transport system permease small subunit
VFRLMNVGLMRLAKLGLITVIVTVGYTVVMRLLFDDSPSWTFDLSSLMMLPLTFLVAAPVAAMKGHVTVDVIVDLVGLRSGRVLEALGQTVCAIFVLYMAYHVTDRFFEILTSGQVTGSARLPYWPAALTVPVGLIALAAEFARQAVVSVRRIVDREEASS